MWRVGRLIAAPLAVMVVSGIAAPAAWAAPEPPVWGGCERFVADTGPIPTAQCGSVSVPVDYANPEGAQAHLAILRVPATGDRVGVLMVNPGGPGASAVDTVAGMAAALADTEIRRRFDLVGFDPRGVGHSTPELRCRTDAEFDAYRREPMADYSPAGVAHIEQIYRESAQRCIDWIGAGFLGERRNGVGGPRYRHGGAALGEEQIDYLGFSYGTELGAAYAERFGDRLRPMVLDGAVDPSLDPIAENLCEMAGFQTAFNAYATHCAQAAGCPLGTDRRSSTTATTSWSTRWCSGPDSPPIRAD